MTKLETLYASIKGLQDLGLPLNEETLKAADELEEQLIKTEILPAMSKDIEPMLSITPPHFSDRRLSQKKTITLQRNGKDNTKEVHRGVQGQGRLGGSERNVNQG